VTEGDVRFEIGFRGGGSTGGEIPVTEWARLEVALRQGSGTVELASGGSRWWVRVEDVAYAFRQERDHRPGFKA
jgi:hypothetical protein